MNATAFNEQDIRDLAADLERWGSIVADCGLDRAIDLPGQMYYWAERLRASLPPKPTTPREQAPLPLEVR